MNDLAFGLSLNWPHCPAGVVLAEEERPPLTRGGLLASINDTGGEAGPISVAVFRAKSPERIVINRQLRNLEHCLAVTFANAKPEGTRRGSLAKFLSEYGFLGQGIAGADGGRGTADAQSLAEEGLRYLDGKQRELRSVLQQAGAGDTVRAVTGLNEALRLHELDKGEIWAPDWARSPRQRMEPPEPAPLAPLRLTPRLDFSPETHKPVLRLGVNNLYDFMMMECAFVALVGARVAKCQHCSNIYLTGPMTGRRSTSVYCSDACRKAAARKRDESEGSVAAL